MSHRSLIVLPDDTAKEIINAIDSARESILIKMFLFSDIALINAVIGANKRGIKIRVMLNPVRNNGELENIAIIEYFRWIMNWFKHDINKLKEFYLKLPFPPSWII